jgi:hypothetical protein
MQLRVELHGLGPSGPFQEHAYTVNVSRSGARLTGSRYSQHPGDTVELRRGKDKARFQVVWVGEPGTPVHGQVGVRTLEPAKNIWSAPLPPPKPAADMTAPVSPPAFSTGAEARPSLSAFSEDAFSPARPDAVAAPEPAAAPTEAVPVDDASGASLFTRAPFAANETDLSGATEAHQPDTVRYGPELLPENYITAETPPPLHKRPILYLGLAAALIAGLGLGWLRSRSTPEETSTVTSAEASSPATSTAPVAPAPSTPAQAVPAPTKPAPATTAPTKAAPVETASRTQPAPSKTAPKASSATSAASAFAVQVGAYGSAATAQALARKLGSRYDRRGIVDAVDSGGRTLHRVRLLTPSEADARALVARIRREQRLDAIVVRPD